MGNSLSCFEIHNEHWDRAHHHVDMPYPHELRGKARDPTQRMDLPLSCYFISSGHNSYLTGNQLSSASGVTTITRCLALGCRVIELDVYNSQLGFDGPVCKHGGTLTAPVLFQTCVEAVAANAFAASRYPVIITLENHTDEEHQKRMAVILRKVLGNSLYVPAAEERGATWKSPTDLIDRVLIRANVSKCCPELAELVYIANSKFKGVRATLEAGTVTSSSFDEQKARKLVKAAFLASGVAWRPSTAGSGSGRPSDTAGSGGPAATLRSNSSKSKKPNKRWPKPNQLPIPERKPDVAEVVGQAIENPSDAATDEAVVAEHTLTEMYDYSSAHLMRVYPGGLRVDSSNLDPHYAWSAGASLAALNWQKYDEPVWINLAMFDQNGGCGYVLKPEWMLGSVLQGEGYVAGANPLPPRPKPKQLSITMYSAYCRQYNNFSIFKDDLYLQMAIVGMPMDNAKQHTITADNTGRLTVDKTFTFSVCYPEVAVLVLQLKDEDFQPGKGMDDCLGHWEVALASMEPGEYKITLTDTDGKERTDRWVRVRLAWEDAAVTPASLPSPVASPEPVATKTAASVGAPLPTQLSHGDAPAPLDASAVVMTSPAAAAAVPVAVKS